ncbi:hypothetical protein BKA65DRAFT_58174 [Rhexocercosporidium sp. MPI-PUGE-AT-0058]|nr:hypothetical protein BKA65DRAFT_58174 [Rhexocercosporidium sp. MPI-PUGE-AT-0058]
MDLLQEYAPPLLSLLSTVEPYTRAPLRTFQTLTDNLTPLITPYLTTLLNTLHTSPAILSLAALLLLAILALQILLFVRRILMFWFRMVMRLVFWGVVVLIVSVVWQRGYRRWEGYQNQGQNGRGGKGYGGGMEGGQMLGVRGGDGITVR